MGPNLSLTGQDRLQLVLALLHAQSVYLHIKLCSFHRAQHWVPKLTECCGQRDRLVVLLPQSSAPLVFNELWAVPSMGLTRVHASMPQGWLWAKKKKANYAKNSPFLHNITNYLPKTPSNASEYGGWDSCVMTRVNTVGLVPGLFGHVFSIWQEYDETHYLPRWHAETERKKQSSTQVNYGWWLAFTNYYLQSWLSKHGSSE